MSGTTLRQGAASAPTRSRKAFTLIELLTTISIVALLIALLLPAVQWARASAWSAQCQANLRQMGVAIHGYLDAHDAFPSGFQNSPSLLYSVHARLLPFLEHGLVHDRLNFKEGFALERNLPDQSGVEIPERVRVRIPVFQCPADPGTARFPFGTNYRACMGAGPYHRSDGPGIFEWFNGSVKSAHVLDGLSQTVAMSERLLGDGDPSVYTPSTDDWILFEPPLPGTFDQPNEFYVRECARVPSRNPLHESGMGMTWASANARHTVYNHVLGPNSSIPDCAPDRVRIQSEGAVSARSHHAGGVHVLFGDGAVRAVSSTIDLAPWRAMATRQGAETQPTE